MKRVMIVNGGELTADFLKDYVKQYMPEAIIAVDGALKLCKLAKLTPTHIVGDFDTIEASILEEYDQETIEIERHKPEKDETDSELAMELAIALHPEEICVLGATGYRMDHTLANLYLLYRPLSEGIYCYIEDCCNRIFLVEKKAVVKKEKKWKYISFFPFTQVVSGITLDGFKYNLDQYTMQTGRMPGLGVSNELIKEDAVVSCEHGILFCIQSHDRSK